MTTKGNIRQSNLEATLADKITKTGGQFTLVAGINNTFPLMQSAPVAGTITGIKAQTNSGTISVSVAINGIAVTGLQTVSVTSTEATTAAAAANTFAVGDRITIQTTSNVDAAMLSVWVEIEI
jgi:hypothetical protein